MISILLLILDLTNTRMPIQDVQLLVAQARVEADDPSLKVKTEMIYFMRGCLLISGFAGIFPFVCVHRKETALASISRGCR